MKKYIITALGSFFIGVMSLFFYIEYHHPIITMLLLSRDTDDFDVENPPVSTDIYRGKALWRHTSYEISAPFIGDPMNTYITHSTPLTFFRQEPALEIRKEDFARVCAVEAKGRTKRHDSQLVIGFKLRPEVREKLRTQLLTSDEKYKDIFSGYEQRFFLEVGGALIKWFWVQEKDAKAYDAPLKNGNLDFDFKIKVPEDQFYKLQFYLTNKLTGTPLTGCTEDIDPNDIPHWESLVKEVIEPHKAFQDSINN